MSDHSKKYIKLAFYATLLNVVLFVPLALIAEPNAASPTTKEQQKQKLEDLRRTHVILDTLMKYAKSSGQWFVDFFDTNNYVSYNQHVDKFGNIIKAMKQDLHAIEVPADNTSIVYASRGFMLFLMRQLESIYKIFVGYKNCSSLWAGRLGMDLSIQQIKEKRNNALYRLHKQLDDFPDLSIKVTWLQKTMNDYGDVIENMSVTDLLYGMVYRLDC